MVGMGHNVFCPDVTYISGYLHMCVCDIPNQSPTNVQVYIQIYIDIYVRNSLEGHKLGTFCVVCYLLRPKPSTLC